MSPRPYQLGKRQTAVAQTRTRILEASREVVLAGSTFSMEEIARRADVARMTVYYQFGSRRGLLEAVFDDLAEQGLVERLPAAFARPEPLDALRGFIEAFTTFWQLNHPLIRRLRAMSILDPDLAESLRGRDDRRRHGARTIMERLSEKYGRPAREHLQEAADALHALTSFGFFDTLAENGRTPDEICQIADRLSRAEIGLEDR